MAEARCWNCRFFEPNSHERTFQDAYEADERPERPDGFIGAMRWMWYPNQFRGPPPGDIEQIVDGMTEKKNLAGRCRRFPKSRQVSRDYGCGEFDPSPQAQEQ